MALWQIFRTGKLTDGQVVNLLKDLLQFCPARQVTFQLAGGVTLSDPIQVEALLAGKDREAISRADYYGSDQKFDVMVRRGVSRTTDSPDNQREASPYFDEIWLKLGEPNQAPRPTSAEEAIAIIDLIRRYVSYAGRPSPDGSNGASEVLQAQFNQLSSLFTQLTVDAEAHRRKLEDDYEGRKVALETAHTAALAAVDKRAAESSAQIAEAQTALDLRSKELDDRDHMHVRRQLRERITTEIKARLKSSLVPRTAGIMRWTILLLSLLGASFFGYSSLTNLTSYTQQIADISNGLNHPSGWSEWLGELPLWSTLLKGALSTVIGLGFLLYAIAWLRQLYQQDVRAHREFERYAYDIDRASWVIETIMEAGTREGGALPDSWIQGATRSLFELPAEHDADPTNDALAALLTASARAEFGPGGAKFEVNGRGARKLAKELET